ncbi:MAG: dihydroorotate dehydrogenase electron transfer subunit [Planctomycetota bacterium]|nr:dihydroorotate dehydrogenase electron transfer subunit [Planctomycetota bacterium]
MTNPLHASHYADHALQATVSILENRQVARDTFQLRFDCPDLARRALPGQFLMLRIAGPSDPLIGRPLALYDTVLDTHGTPRGVDVMYLVKGNLTKNLCRLQTGQRLDIWGPLGNGFAAPSAKHLIMVAGGIGQTPMLALARERMGLRSFGDPGRRVPQAERVTFCYGARSADYLAGVDDFQQIGAEVRLATDDGSRGHQGLVTDLLCEILEAEEADAEVVCCGPEPMMKAVSELAIERGVPCQVSLETPMACGIGICFTCVAKVDCGGAWDYQRTCVEGPVFDARRLVWD